MIIKYTDEEDSEERDRLIESILPKQTIISEVLEPLIEKKLFKALAECVRRELDIYRNYPKRKNEEPLAEMVKTFNPTNNETCFMGKAYKGNDARWLDDELLEYRKAIGTIPHYAWGDCTLLEIWGGDHFEDYNKMVVGAFEYGMRLKDTCPKIVFHINPLFKNKNSKHFKVNARQQEEKDFMDDLMARAMVFGVKTPEQARRDMRRR